MVGTYRVGEQPVAIAFSDFHGGGHIWVANMSDNTVMKLSRDGHRVAVVKVGSKPAAIVPFRDDLVVVNSGDQSLSRVPLGSGGTGMTME